MGCSMSVLKYVLAFISVLSASLQFAFAQSLLVQNQTATIEQNLFNADALIGQCPTQLSQLTDDQGADQTFKNYKSVHDEILKSQIRIRKQIKVNTPLMETKFKISLELLRFMRNVKTLEPVFLVLHEMLANPKYKSFRDSASFRALLSSRSFLKSLLVQNYSSAADPAFMAFMLQIKQALVQEGVIRALEVTALEGIDLTKIETLKDGLALVQLFKDVDLSKIEKNIDLNHAYRNIVGHISKSSTAVTPELKSQLQAFYAQIAPASEFPFPSEAKYKGVISKAYQNRLKRELVQFLKFYDDSTLDHSTSIYQKEDDAAWSTISYDSIVGRFWSQQAKGPFQLEFQSKLKPVSLQELVAIDALARTIYGEVNSCEASHIEQATLVAKIVDDRAKAIQFSGLRQNQNEAVIEAMLSRVQASFSEANGVKIKDLEAALRITRNSVYGGASDFGRQDISTKAHLAHPVTQIVSRGDQFSGWRSVQRINYGIVKSPNPKSVLPSVEIKLNAPLALGDISALYNQLCPKRDTETWKRMVNLAKSVVLDPNFSKLVTWKGPLAQAPLFYTHKMNMTFLNEIKLPQLTDRRSMIERMTPNEVASYEAANGSCTQIRLWVSKDPQRYFPSPGVK